MAYMKHISKCVLATKSGHSIRFLGANGEPSFVPDIPETIKELQAGGAVMVSNVVDAASTDVPGEEAVSDVPSKSKTKRAAN